MDKSELIRKSIEFNLPELFMAEQLINDGLCLYNKTSPMYGSLTTLKNRVVEAKEALMSEILVEAEKETKK